MENDLAKQIFNGQFKFKLNQEVRHKGDSKNGMSSDMGLLVIERTLQEDQDDDGNVHYNRNYICRMIRFSGSGDLGRFKESELLNMTEFNEKSLKQETEREEMRADMYALQKEIFTSFAVKRNTRIYLKNADGTVDKTNVYVVTGFSRSDEGTFLSIRMEAGEGKT